MKKKIRELLNKLHENYDDIEVTYLTSQGSYHIQIIDAFRSYDHYAKNEEELEYALRYLISNSN